VAEVTLREATRVWAYVGVNSFGGPAGQIAVMHREVVDERGWVSERRFLHALNYCMLLPGPEAQQLATYIGWLLNGVRGGLVAGSLFVLPGAVVMLILSVVYAVYGQVGWVSGLLFGLQAAVVAIVVQALIRVAGRTLRTAFHRLLALAAFVALFFFAVPFPIVIAAAGLLGWWVGRADPAPVEEDQDDGPLTQPAARRALLAAGVCLVLWLLPVFLLVSALGGDHVLAQEAVLFSKTAVLTFGGAYAVLAYVSQQAVQNYGWITTSDMTTGLGLAETTPGPLILVLQFVGFLAAYNDPGTLPPLLAGVFGAAITLWVTFLPCFMFIFAGAPYVDALRRNRGLHHALSGVSAAVVGVIANLALWFALHTFFETTTLDRGPLTVTWPQWATLDPVAVGLAVLAGVLVFALKWPTLRVLGLVAVAGAGVAVLT
jgi:chromate transporter